MTVQCPTGSQYTGRSGSNGPCSSSAFAATASGCTAADSRLRLDRAQSSPRFPAGTIYVVGDERDLVGVRTNHRSEAVYLYRLNTSVEDARRLLLVYLERINELADRAESITS